MAEKKCHLRHTVMTCPAGNHPMSWPRCPKAWNEVSANPKGATSGIGEIAPILAVKWLTDCHVMQYNSSPEHHQGVYIQHSSTKHSSRHSASSGEVWRSETKCSSYLAKLHFKSVWVSCRLSNFLPHPKTLHLAALATTCVNECKYSHTPHSGCIPASYVPQ